MTNTLRSPDPVDQFPPSSIINEPGQGTRHPGRFEPRTASIPNTQLVRNDAVRVYRNAALSVATNDFILWDSPIPNPQTALVYDTTGIWTTPSGTTFTIPLTGKVTGSWAIKCQISWPGTGAGSTRQVAIIRNGVAIAVTAGSALTQDQLITDVIYNPSYGDLIKIQVYHDAGGTLALNVGPTKTFCSIIHTG
jgi:hypothetical protein